MKNTILLLSLLSVINFYSSGTLASSMDVLSAVKNYTFKEGEPYGLPRVYQTNTPDSGFSPYYVFLKLGIENAYPFVFNREGISGKDEPYSRCNVVLKVNNQSLIPDRKYKSGYAEDSEPCLGIEKLRVVQGSKNIKWFVTDALYQPENDTTEKTKEVYFYSGGSFCFSESKSVKLAANKITMEDLKNLVLNKDEFEECAK
jgi:hypothetical protein